MTTKKKILVTTLLIILVIISFFVFLLSRQKIKVKNISVYNKDYDMTVFVAKDLPKQINKKVKKMITNQQKTFLDKVKTKETDFKYELLINYETNKYEDYRFITYTIYKYVGQNHPEESCISYYYNVKTGEELYADYFFKEAYLERLSKLSEEYLVDYFIMNNQEVYEDFIKDGTRAVKDNFKHLFLNNNGLNILFPPYQVAPWSSGKSNITIPFNYLKEVLKDEFLKNIEIIPEVATTPNERDLTKYTAKKLVAITFDDGPSDHSRKLINYAKTKDVRYTFFVLGSRLNEFGNILKEVYQAGHQICAHSYSHRNFTKLSSIDIRKEMASTNKLIKDQIGIISNCYRPPYGATNSNIRETLQMHEFLWNVDTNDWKYRNSDKVYEHIINYAHDGAIILLHDIYPTSVEAAIRASNYLLDNGYALLTIEELAKAKGISINAGQSYSQIK